MFAALLLLVNFYNPLLNDRGSAYVLTNIVEDFFSVMDFVLCLPDTREYAHTYFCGVHFILTDLSIHYT